MYFKRCFKWQNLKISNHLFFIINFIVFWLWKIITHKQFELFKSHHKEGDFVEGVITGSKEMLRCTPSRTLYFVNVEGYPCGCITRSELEEGSTHTFSLYQYDYEKKQITLSYNLRYDR